MYVHEICVRMIKTDEKRRPIRQKTVQKLAESIEMIGLQSPIILRGGSAHPVLISGAHRLEAFKLLGREWIPAVYVSADDIHAKLAEIDENLIRENLSPAQEAIAIDLRAELIKALKEEKPDTNVSGLGKGGRGKKEKAPASDRDLEKKTGRSREVSAAPRSASNRSALVPLKPSSEHVSISPEN